MNHGWNLLPSSFPYGGILALAFVYLFYALWAVPPTLFLPGTPMLPECPAFPTLRRLDRFLLGVNMNPTWYYLTTPGRLVAGPYFCRGWHYGYDKAAPFHEIFAGDYSCIIFQYFILKRGIYLLPLFPAFAIFFANGVLDFMENGNVIWRRRLGWVYGFLFILMGTAPFAIMFTEYNDLWMPAMALSGLALFICGSVVLPLSRKNEMSYLHLQVFGSFILLSFFGAVLFLPVINTHKSARSFCRPIAEITEKGADFDSARRFYP